MNPKWKTVGSMNYNLGDGYAQDYFFGLEYESCCWAIHGLAGRSFRGIDSSHSPEFDNVVFLQLQLKGLGNVGTNDPAKLLMRKIWGYREQFN